MNQKKIIILLITITLYINYKNYIEENTEKLNSQIIYIKNRVTKEVKLNKNNKESNKTAIEDYEKLMYNENNISYSEAMGKFQQTIEKLAKPECKIMSIRWNEMPTIEESWYEILNINLSLQCSATAFIKFQNNLKKNRHIIDFKQLSIIRERKVNAIRISTQITTYKVKKYIK